MGMKLYSFGESGNAYKCALALTLTGLEWEPVFVDFFGGKPGVGHSSRHSFSFRRLRRSQVRMVLIGTAWRAARS